MMWYSILIRQPQNRQYILFHLAFWHIMASTKLNREVIKRIAELIELRMTWVHIAVAVGVSRDTLQNWRNRGEADREAYKTGQRTFYHQLVDAIDAARTEFV